ncbi:MAG: GntR family transcriptional regulator [Armatimonadota bacterium]|nr:GntR family transcriptional regulator [bacterium]
MRKTLRHRIADSILSDYISNGKLNAGEVLPTVRDLQREYGVSCSTVLSAISILETQGLVESRHGSGCYIAENKNEIMQGNTAKSGTRSLGLICNSRIDLFQSQLHRGMDTVCREQGYGVMVAATNYVYEEEQLQVQRLIDAGCEGIALYPVVRTKAQVKSDYLNSRFTDFPIVVVDLALPGQKRPQVLFDNYRLGRDMTRYLLNKGHKRIAFMDYRTQDSEFVHRSTMDRYKGYLDAMKAAGRPVEESDRWMLDKSMQQDATDSVARLLHSWLEQKDHPTALIALEDSRAALTITVARELGINVPDDLEVVGFDDHPAGRVIRPHFTTTCPDFTRAGEIAADVLMQLIRGEQDTQIVYMLSVPIKQRETLSVSREALEWREDAV